MYALSMNRCDAFKGVHSSRNVEASAGLANNNVLRLQKTGKRFSPCKRSALSMTRMRVQASSSTDIERDQWKSTYPAWESSLYRDLTAKYGVTSVSPQQAAEMLESGQAVLLDVRLEEDHAEAHPKGAISVPAFRVIKMGQGGLSSMLKAVLMQANGVTPTETHPEFVDRARQVAAAGKTIIVACEAGGSLESSPSFPTGKASRSLKAAWRLLHYGVVEADRIYHLGSDGMNAGGVLGWYQAGYPFNGTYDVSRAFRSPNAVSRAQSASKYNAKDE